MKRKTIKSKTGDKEEAVKDTTAKSISKSSSSESDKPKKKVIEDIVEYKKQAAAKKYEEDKTLLGKDDKSSASVAKHKKKKGGSEEAKAETGDAEKKKGRKEEAKAETSDKGKKTKKGAKDEAKVETSDKGKKKDDKVDETDKKGKKKRGKKGATDASDNETPTQPTSELDEMLDKIKYTEPIEVTPEEVESVFDTVTTGEAPIDLSLDYENLGQVILPGLQWYNFNSMPVDMKMSNTVTSVVLTGKWAEEEMPYVRGGPLTDDYVFSQIHFHWPGIVTELDRERRRHKLWIISGSEHTIDQEQYPFEMHAVFHRRSCGNHEIAKRTKNGIIIMVYMCGDVTESDNDYLEPITSSIFRVFDANRSRHIYTVPLSRVVPTFSDDYILYKGYLKFKCNHDILWFISRESFTVSLNQLCKFQGVLDRQGKPLTSPFRETQPLDNRPMLHVNPSNELDEFIHHREEDLDMLSGDDDDGGDEVPDKKPSMRTESKKKKATKKKTPKTKD